MASPVENIIVLNLAESKSFSISVKVKERLDLQQTLLTMKYTH